MNLEENKNIYTKYLILSFIIFLALFILHFPKCHAKTKSKNINQAASQEVETDYEATKKTSSSILGHGKGAFKFGSGWFLGANFNWTKGTYRKIKEWTNAAIGFIISGIVFIVELIFNVLYRWILGATIILYSLVVLLVGILFVPVAWIWDKVFG